MACLIRVPVELVKTRTQTSAYSPLGSTSQRLSSLSAFRAIWNSSSPSSPVPGFGHLSRFYVGFGSTVARDVPFSAVQFTIYEPLKSWLGKRRKGSAGGSGDDVRRGSTALDGLDAAICGCVAGGISAIITTPLDVVKTRVMLDLKVSLMEFRTGVAAYYRLRPPEVRDRRGSVASGVYTPQKVWLHCFLVSFRAQFGYLLEVRSSWACTNGLHSG